MRETVRDVGEHADVDAGVHATSGPRGSPPARSVRAGNTRGAVPGVGRADGNVMAAPGERLREDRREPGDAAVRPRVLVVRRHVEETQAGLRSFRRGETAALE